MTENVEVKQFRKVIDLGGCPMCGEPLQAKLTYKMTINLDALTLLESDVVGETKPVALSTLHHSCTLVPAREEEFVPGQKMAVRDYERGVQSGILTLPDGLEMPVVRGGMYWK